MATEREIAEILKAQGEARATLQALTNEIKELPEELPDLTDKLEVEAEAKFFGVGFPTTEAERLRTALEDLGSMLYPKAFGFDSWSTAEWRAPSWERLQWFFELNRADETLLSALGCIRDALGDAPVWRYVCVGPGAKWKLGFDYKPTPEQLAATRTRLDEDMIAHRLLAGDEA